MKHSVRITTIVLLLMGYGIVRAQSVSFAEQWTTSGPFNRPKGIVVEDFNGDLKLDIAVVNYNNDDITVMFGNGDGTLSASGPNIRASSLCPSAVFPVALVADDFNGDRKKDLAVANAGCGLTVLFGDGAGHFTIDHEYTNANLLDIVKNDFNQDGNIDIALNGNEFSMSPPLGRYDALNGLVFSLQ